MEWPPDDPRVRLEGLIELEPQRGKTGAGMREWLEIRGGDRLFLRPYAVAWAGDDLIVADPDAGRVVRIERNGQLRFSPAHLLAQPIGVAVCADGIVVSDSRAGRVALLDGDLQLVEWLAEGLARPTGVDCSRGAVFLTETAAHRVLVLEADGGRRTIGERGAEPGQFNFPTALVVDGDTLWVADSMNFRVQRIDARSGQPLGAFGELGDGPGGTSRLIGIALDTMGLLWVADG
jgi:hypothetical protein